MEKALKNRYILSWFIYVGRIPGSLDSGLWKKKGMKGLTTSSCFGVSSLSRIQVKEGVQGDIRCKVLAALSIVK